MESYECAGTALRIASEQNVEPKLSLDISHHGLGMLLYADESKELSNLDYNVAKMITASLKTKMQNISNERF